MRHKDTLRRRFVYFGREDAAADQQMWHGFADQQREDKPWLLHAFVNVDSDPELVERFKVRSTPTFILFRDRKVSSCIPGMTLLQVRPDDLIISS